MEEGLIALKSGTSVDIKRTDGRVHSAVVSGVNWDTRSVTVEWFEKGETKGKEIEMEAILNLNAHLLAPSTNQDDPVVNNNKKATRAAKTNNPTMPVASSKVPYRATRNQARPTNILPAVNGHGDTNIPMRTAETVAATPTSAVPVTPAAPRHTVPVAAPTGRSNKGAAVVESAIQNQNQNVGPTGAGAGGGGANNANNRRSNVVKEVERLKKNREERRQRQAELKEEKEALMNQDPGNPNWEFLAMIREYRSGIDFRPLRGSENVEDHQITVCVRKRPLNKKEIGRKEIDVVTIPSRDQLVVHEPKNKVDLTKYLENAHFRFDYAFDEYCTNEIVYKYTAQPLVQTIFEGGFATCFAYGQTGSGKTHTMGGDFQGRTQDCKKGIYAMAAKDVFKYLRSPKYQPLGLIISASFFEIYSGKVFDLLADKAKLRVLEDGKQQVQIVGLTEQVVGSVDDVLKLIQHGNAARTSGQTSANSNSSRSHAVFQIVARSPGTRIHGKFSLIDLAGNERGADTSSANRQTRMEGAEINKSLLALKECIRALGRKNAHLPFRASKLTQVLRDSFIGEKSRTCMIAMISPGLSSCEHSLNTLRYADRVKELAANDPSENKLLPGQDGGSPVQDGCLDDSLAQLRSLNEGDFSADLFTFHEAVSQLQLQEEEVLDAHKSVLEVSQRWHDVDFQLLTDTRDVDYDQDGRHLIPLRLARSSTQRMPALSSLQSHRKSNPVVRSQSQSRIPASPSRAGTSARSKSQSRVLIPNGSATTIRSPSPACSYRDKLTVRSPLGRVPTRGSSSSAVVQRSKSQSRVGERSLSVNPSFQQKPVNNSKNRTLPFSPIRKSASQTWSTPIKGTHLTPTGRVPLATLHSNMNLSKANRHTLSTVNGLKPSAQPKIQPRQESSVKCNTDMTPLRKCWSQVKLANSKVPGAPPIKRSKSQVGLSLATDCHDNDDVCVSLKMLDDDASLPSWYHRRMVQAPMSRGSLTEHPSSDSLMKNRFLLPLSSHRQPVESLSTINGDEACKLKFFSQLSPSVLSVKKNPSLQDKIQHSRISPGEICEESCDENLRSLRMHGKSLNIDTAQPSLQGGKSRRCKDLALCILKNLMIFSILPFFYFFFMLYLT